jgi:outer membrane protein assembly factor BamB
MNWRSAEVLHGRHALAGATNRPAADLAPLAVEFMCVDERDGKVVWQFRAPSGVAPAGAIAAQAITADATGYPLYGDPRPIHLRR